MDSGPKGSPLLYEMLDALRSHRDSAVRRPHRKASPSGQADKRTLGGRLMVLLPDNLITNFWIFSFFSCICVAGWYGMTGQKKRKTLLLHLHSLAAMMLL